MQGATFVDLPKLKGEGAELFDNFYTALGCDKTKKNQIIDPEKIIMNRKDWFKYQSIFLRNHKKFLDTLSFEEQMDLMATRKNPIPSFDRSVPTGKIKLLDGWLVEE